MSGWLVVLVLGQLDGGNAPSRLVRTSSLVCDETPSDGGTVQRRCSPRSASPPLPMVPDIVEPDFRLVAEVGILFGLQFSSTRLPELSFIGDYGMRFKKGGGVILIAHAFIAWLGTRQPLDGFEPTLQRYGLGAGFVLGDRSNLLVGLCPTLVVTDTRPEAGFQPAATLLARGSLHLWRWLTALLMPVVTFTRSAFVFSASAGLGATF